MRKFISVLVFVLMLVSMSASADQAVSVNKFEIGGLQYTLASDWIEDSMDDGGKYHYRIDGDNIWLLSLWENNPKELNFDSNNLYALEYINGAFNESGLWTYPRLINRGDIFGVGGNGYVDGLPAAMVFVETPYSNVGFILSNMNPACNPHYLLDQLFELLPWINEEPGTTKNLVFKCGQFEYQVPEHWTHKVESYNDSMSHSTDRGNVVYGVSLHNEPGDGAVAAKERLSKMFPDSQVEYIYDDVLTLYVTGETFSGMQLCQACVVDGSSYLLLSYDHYGVSPDIQFQEFMELLQCVRTSE